MSVNSVNGLSFKGPEQPQQKRGASSVTPALLVGSAVGAGTYFGLKSPMTQDQFSSSLKEGKEIKYSSELTKAEQNDVEKLTKELKAEAPKDAKPDAQAETKPAAKPEAQPGAKPKVSATDKTVNEIFGKEKELSPEAYLDKRYGKPAAGKDALANLNEKIKTAEAENVIPKAKKGVTPKATLASTLSKRKASVASVETMLADYNAAVEANKAAVAARKIANGKNATQEEVKAARALEKALDKAFTKVKKHMTQADIDTLQKAVEERISKLKKPNARTAERIANVELRKLIDKKLVNAKSLVTETEKAIIENTTKITKMKADLDLVKSVKYGEKIAKSAVSESFIATSKAVQAIENNVKASNLETVFKAIGQKLPKVKSLTKAGIFGGIAAIVTGVALSMMGGSKEA